MQSPSTRMKQFEEAEQRQPFELDDDETGAQIMPLIMRAPQETPVEAPSRKGVLESRRRRAARRAGRHG